MVKLRSCDGHVYSGIRNCQPARRIFDRVGCAGRHRGSLDRASSSNADSRAETASGCIDLHVVRARDFPAYRCIGAGDSVMLLGILSQYLLQE